MKKSVFLFLLLKNPSYFVLVSIFFEITCQSQMFDFLKRHSEAEMKKNSRLNFRKISEPKRWPEKL